MARRCRRHHRRGDGLQTDFHTSPYFRRRFRRMVRRRNQLCRRMGVMSAAFPAGVRRGKIAVCAVIAPLAGGSADLWETRVQSDSQDEWHYGHVHDGRRRDSRAMAAFNLSDFYPGEQASCSTVLRWETSTVSGCTLLMTTTSHSACAIGAAGCRDSGVGTALLADASASDLRYQPRI